MKSASGLVSERGPIGGSAVVVRVAASWVVTGALFKLLLGTPLDLPSILRDHATASLGLSATTLFQAVVGIELAVSLAALIVPRVLAGPLFLLLVGFLLVLAGLIVSGAESCGCFGSAFPVPPWLMALVDFALSACIWAARPWGARTGWSAAAGPIGASILVGGALPILLISTAEAPVGAPQDLGVSSGPRFVEWRPDHWLGERIGSTGLGRTLGSLERLPNSADWVIFSPTCSHCADYLRDLALVTSESPLEYVLVELPGNPNAETVVEELPAGHRVVLPKATTYVITPPWVMEVRNGVVTATRQP